MKKILVLITIIFSLTSKAQEREIMTLHNGWKFAKTTSIKAKDIDFDDSTWQDITIPHDWAIEGPFQINGDGNTGKLPWKGEGWYRKQLDIPSRYTDKKVYLIFDGVMAFPKVYINGNLAGEWDYGYNSFYVDITDYIRIGEANLLAVHANTTNHDSRWYPGAGIYRKVQLLVTNPVHVDIWGTYVNTPIIKPNYADIRTASSILNEAENDSNIRVEHIVLNPGGKELVKKSITKTLAPGKKDVFENTLQVANPLLWDIDQPHLYKIITNVYQDNTLSDTQWTSFGIRSIRFTADDGFYLNDRRVQLKGVNLHHDHGPLGAAFYTRAMERQLEIMKAMGVNAIRNSHNVAAPEVLELCDKMGILVFNEIFDKYDGKADITGETDFEEFAHRNIRNFVKRDRNHPSVFLWSVGNEIGDVQWNIDNGFLKLHTMVNYVRKYDPTRPVTLVNDNLESAKLRHFDFYDVHAWNYGRRYRLARQLEPNKSVVISESASTLSTRGFYELPLPKIKTDFTKSLQVSSYDLNAPEWAEIADDDFMWQQDENYIAGEFVWTGFDYLGEPTPYFNKAVKEMGFTDKEASRSSYFGIVDLVGIPKDRYYLYKSYWKPEETTVHILPHWNWKERIGKNVPVFVYSNGDCAELFINDTSQGKQCKKPNSNISTERFRLMWKDVVYSPGTVKAVAYKNGQIIGERILKTAKEPYRLQLTADRNTIKSNGQDLSYILIEAYDKEGSLCPLADHKIDITLTGAGMIAGVGNGNPQSFDPFKSKRVKLFNGKAMIIIKSGYHKGNTKLTVSTNGLKSDSVSIRVQ